MNNHFSKMFERDMDILIIQEFIGKKAFANLFLKQIGLTENEDYTITDTYQSLYSQDGESDITILLVANGRKQGIFIEDKINAITMDEQSNRYTLRAENMKKQGKIEDYFVFLAAPQSYIQTHKNDRNAQYDFYVSYEDMLSVVESFAGAENKYKADMIKFALKEKEKGYLMIEDERVMRFWELFSERCKHCTPKLVITNNKKEKGRDSYWVWFKTPFPKVSIVYKTNRGIINLRIPKYADKFDVFVELVKPLMQQEMVFEKMPGSANVTIRSEKLILDTIKDYTNDIVTIDKVLYEIEKMYDFTLEISKKIEI